METDDKKYGAKFIAETLKGYNVTHIFFVDAILRESLIEMERLGIKRVLAHTEKAAAYMADGYARASHKPGICMSQSVGAANLAAGLQDAYLGHSPVIAITGRRPPIAEYRNSYQEILHDSLFTSVTKFHANIISAEQLPYLVRQAFREATSGSPRPVHLDVQGHIGKEVEVCDHPINVTVEHTYAHFPAIRTEPTQDDLRTLSDYLRQASRPLIIAGGGATSSSAGPEIVQLAETLQIPVSTSLSGKGVIPEDHPLSVGVCGSYSRSCTNQIAWDADVVFFIGSSTGGQVTNDWRLINDRTQVLQVDIDPSEIGRNYANTVGIVGDAKATVRKLLNNINKKPSHEPWLRQVRSLVDSWRRETEAQSNSDAIPIRPERLCKELTSILPSDVLLVADTGHSGIWTGTMVELKFPTQSFIRAAGSLGWGFPASLGAKCGVPDRPVICFTGDGGFWYHLSELETARRCGIKTVTVINNNHAFGQCIAGVNIDYGSRSGRKEDFYKFGPVSFSNIAKEMGCIGIHVTKPENIRKALLDALSSDLPAVVEVETDPACEAPAPWSNAS